MATLNSKMSLAFAALVLAAAPRPGLAAPGNLRLYPAGSPVPPVSAVNYSAGQTRGNDAVIGLGASGQVAIRCTQASGTVHAILDVTGYFE